MFVAEQIQFVRDQLALTEDHLVKADALCFVHGDHKIHGQPSGNNAFSLETNLQAGK
jgi:hypothetical protein